jgi:prepilin-type N-terminal cleavage/methylation domain-containing protein
MSSKKSNHQGFTLLEILLVVGIIAILAGITIVAINPSKQLAQVRNTERRSDLKQIANAITQFYIDHSYYPTSLTGDLTEICDTGASSTPSGITCTDMIDLSELVPTYLTAIPKDPSATTTDHAGYSVIKTGNQIGLSAPAELNQVITIGTVPEVVVDACGTSGDETDPDCWSADQGNLTWSDANAACAALGSGWRLPAVWEIEDGLTAQFITDPPTVTGFEYATFYSSSNEVGGEGYWTAAYNLNGSGIVDSYDYYLKIDGSRVRCIR